MSKFIKVTDLESGWDIIIFTHRIAGIVPHHQSGSIITGVDGKNIEVAQSLEQIEAQLLRDEFATAALNGLLANSSGVVQKSPMSGTGYINGDSETVSAWAYDLADAMLKERMK